MAMVATHIGAFIVIFAGAVAGMKFVEKAAEAKAQKRRLPTELRFAWFAIFGAVFMIAIFMAPVTSGERTVAVGVVVLALPIVFVSPRLLVPTAGAMLLLLMCFNDDRPSGKRGRRRGSQKKRRSLARE